MIVAALKSLLALVCLVIIGSAVLAVILWQLGRPAWPRFCLRVLSIAREVSRSAWQSAQVELFAQLRKDQ